MASGQTVRPAAWRDALSQGQGTTPACLGNGCTWLTPAAAARHDLAPDCSYTAMAKSGEVRGMAAGARSTVAALGAVLMAHAALAEGQAPELTAELTPAGKAIVARIL